MTQRLVFLHVKISKNAGLSHRGELCVVHGVRQRPLVNVEGGQCPHTFPCSDTYFPNKVVVREYLLFLVYYIAIPLPADLC